VAKDKRNTSFHCQWHIHQFTGLVWKWFKNYVGWIFRC